MSESPVMPIADQQNGGPLPRVSHGAILIRRIRFLCAIGISAAIFWHVGWHVVMPQDPQGPVSLLMVDQGVIAMAELLGLAVVTSGLAVAICGARSADRGPLAIAVGLATLGLRGSQLDTLVMYRMHAVPTGRTPLDPFPVTALMAECWLWLALIAVGFVVGRWVESWFGPPQQTGHGPSDRRGAGRRPDARYDIPAVILASVLAWLALSCTLGSPREAILKGQMYFGIAASFLVAGLVAHACFKTGSRLWSLILVAVVASAAYLVAGPDARSIAHARETGTYLVLQPLARPLPVEYAAMGALGALWERDWMYLFRTMLGMSTEDRG